ncbi:organic cation transporter protein-like [Babylonia areolata]|uniref:organic cation transporter protein-like n=1 Tax=Babylonia areolata TaxID=304850 RepID=UPI003FD164DE
MDHDEEATQPCLHTSTTTTSAPLQHSPPLPGLQEWNGSVHGSEGETKTKAGGVRRGRGHQKEQSPPSGADTSAVVVQPLLSPDQKSPNEACQAASAEVDSHHPQQGDVVTYDDLLTSLGHWGRHQKRLFCLLTPLTGWCAIQILIPIFIMAVPDHRCALPNVTNDTWHVQGAGHASLLNLSIPSSPSSPYDSCHLYHPSPSSSSRHRLVYVTSDNASSSHDVMAGGREGEESGEEERGGNREVEEKMSCHKYVYDTSTFVSTMTSELNLVCDRAMYRSHGLMCLMLGSMVGAQVVGFLSDALGRRSVLMVSIVVYLAVAVGKAWSQSLPAMMIGHFLTGLCTPGCFAASFVMSVEVVGASRRRWMGYGHMVTWALGMVLLAGLAFLLRDWHYLQLTSGLIALPFLSYYWLIPESPRWLINRGRRAEAEVVLRKTAQVNGVPFPADLFLRVRSDHESGVSLLRTCSSPSLIIRTAILILAWMVNSLTYYGLSWGAGNLHGDLYVNFFLMGLVELLALVLCILLLDRVGRRPLNCGLMLVAGVTCTATLLPIHFAPPSAQWVTVVLAMIGKLGIAGSFGTIWIFSSELFPTALRNSGVGLCNLSARVGGILAPYIANLGDVLGAEVSMTVPMMIYGLSSIVAGLLLLLLPETLHASLPETAQDALHMDRKKKEKNQRPVDDMSIMTTGKKLLNST